MPKWLLVYLVCMEFDHNISAKCRHISKIMLCECIPAKFAGGFEKGIHPRMHQSSSSNVPCRQTRTKGTCAAQPLLEQVAQHFQSNDNYLPCGSCLRCALFFALYITGCVFITTFAVPSGSGHL